MKLNLEFVEPIITFVAFVVDAKIQKFAGTKKNTGGIDPPVR